MDTTYAIEVMGRLVASIKESLTMNVLITLAIGVFTALLILYYWCARTTKGKKVLQAITENKGPRFRKRDRIMFYGRKAMRRVSTLANSQLTTARKLSNKKKQLEVLKMARKLLLLRKEKQPTLKNREPPASLLEPDRYDDTNNSQLPSEVMYMLKSVRVLGNFEQPIFLELCRYMEPRFVPAGTYLFKIGDPDDSIYVVQTGKLRVFITDQEGETHLVKHVGKGDNIYSLLSVMDVISGQPSMYKTVSAIAEMDTTVLRLPAKSFQIVLERYPESLVRMVQIIMVRLQRVTFMALHNYLGLSYELMRPHPAHDGQSGHRPLSIHSIQLSPTGSPMKVVRSSHGETVTKVTNYDHDQEGSKQSATVTPPVQVNVEEYGGASELKRNNSKTRVKASRHSAESDPSDFDAALTRARIMQVDDPVASGSPPMKSGMEESPTSDGHLAPSKKVPKKVSITEDPRSVHSLENASSRHDALYLTDEELLSMAIEDIAQVFGLEDDNLLEGKCYLRYLKAGVTITKQGQQDASLFFSVTGQLCVTQTIVGHRQEEATLFMVGPGELVGSLAVLTGEPSFYKIKARTDAIVVVISKNDFYAVMKGEPKVVLHVGKTVVKRMSPFVRQIDFALDWSYMEAGRSLFRQKDPSDCVYIVLNGRLRSVVQLPSGKKELVAEYGRGELVGIVEVLTMTERATTILAVRDSELAQLPDHLLNLIKRRFPQIVTRLIHLLGQRILGNINRRPGNMALLENPNQEPRPAVANLSTVTILPVSDDVPLSNFTLELQHSLNAIGSTLRLTSEIVQNRLGASALDAVSDYRLSSWLGQQEDIHRMVLYQCDPSMTHWTKRCIRQADAILIVGIADQEPTVGRIEKEMEHLAVRAQKELILLHREDSEHPKNTVQWLNMRDWCSSHHHIRCPKRVFSKRAQPRMMQVYRDLFETEPDRLSDFSRLARVLTGTAIGLVLGGGGARGCSHAGIIRAMVEAGIPIDIVGGTSIGSFMGALWAEEMSLVRFTQRAREWSMEFGKTWKKVFDLTYPVTAMFKGAAFNHSIKDVFKGRQIEDLWLPYFCVTTDITASKMRIHTNGSLWRYVRGSMSLSGYLPPLCDPVDGHLLLDGGYVNNLPADVMKSMGAQNVFAVDVGSQDDDEFTNFGDELSGWWMLWKRWNPWAHPVKIPNMAEIQSRLAYVSCCRQLEAVKTSGECEYIRPPIDKYNTLQFGSFDEIMDVGFNHGKTLFSAWTKRGLVKELFCEKKDEDKEQVRLQQKNLGPAEADFTDLAELISRIDYPIPDPLYSADDEFEEDRISSTSEPGLLSRTHRPMLKLDLKRAQSVGGTPLASPTSTATPSEEFQEAIDDDDYLDEEEMSDLTSGGEESPRRGGTSLFRRKPTSESVHSL